VNKFMARCRPIHVGGRCASRIIRHYRPRQKTNNLVGARRTQAHAGWAAAACRYNINSTALIVNWCTEMIASAAARPILLIARMA